MATIMKRNENGAEYPKSMVEESLGHGFTIITLSLVVMDLVQYSLCKRLRKIFCFLL